jgi:HEAT repeat protein
MESLAIAMLQAEGKIQRAAAEAMAELEAEGEAVLRDGIKDPDLLVRRAAAYGLAATGEPWASKLLEEIEWEEDEWLVRNAAAEARAMMRLELDEDAPPHELALPQADATPWLHDWAAEQGTATLTEAAALAALVRALSNGDQSTRQEAAQLLGQLADPKTIDALRKRLHDPEPSVRQAALVALDEISRRYDMTIAPRG